MLLRQGDSPFLLADGPTYEGEQLRLNTSYNILVRQDLNYILVILWLTSIKHVVNMAASEAYDLVLDILVDVHGVVCVDQDTAQLPQSRIKIRNQPRDESWKP